MQRQTGAKVGAGPLSGFLPHKVRVASSFDLFGQL